MDNNTDMAEKAAVDGRPVKQGADKYGDPVRPGDSVCFTLDMRRDRKPIVKANVSDILDGKWIVPEYNHSDTDVQWAEREGRLVRRVLASRTVKCL